MSNECAVLGFVINEVPRCAILNKITPPAVREAIVEAGATYEAEATGGAEVKDEAEATGGTGATDEADRK